MQGWSHKYRVHFIWTILVSVTNILEGGWLLNTENKNQSGFMIYWAQTWWHECNNKIGGPTSSWGLGLVFILYCIKICMVNGTFEVTLRLPRHWQINLFCYNILDKSIHLTPQDTFIFPFFFWVGFWGFGVRLFFFFAFF